MPTTTSSDHAGGAPASARLAYGAVSAALLLPVTVWPWAWFARAGLEAAADAVNAWLVAAALLLVAAVAVDSLLDFSRRAADAAALQAAAWVLAGALGASLALRWDWGAFAMGGMFFLHALRSALPLWRDAGAWWQWMAWGRDVLAALSLFYWFCRLAAHG